MQKHPAQHRLQLSQAQPERQTARAEHGSDLAALFARQSLCLFPEYLNGARRRRDQP